MPTKRTRVTRKQNIHITDHAVELYRRGLALVSIRDTCVESDEMCTHAECTEYHEVSTELDRLLGLRPHQPSPLVDYDDIKTWPIHGDPVAEIKKALDAALGEKPITQPPRK